jgi:hypothetical protein
LEKVMSKTNDTERTRELEADRAELLDSELDTVIGSASDLGKYITKAVDDAISGTIAGSLGPPLVWVGCGYVPQWW